MKPGDLVVTQDYGLASMCLAKCARVLNQNGVSRRSAFLADVAALAVAAVLANVGLTAIITYAVPVLMFLYPLAITLILLALLGHFFDHDRAVYAWVTGLTLVAAGNDERFTITALFDNLGKGASGAAVQNMNLMLGFEMTAGLALETPPAGSPASARSERT